jgi:hypothetical protein
MAYVHSGGAGRDLDHDLVELRAAVGIETHEGSSRNGPRDAKSPREASPQDTQSIPTNGPDSSRPSRPTAPTTTVRWTPTSGR